MTVQLSTPYIDSERHDTLRHRQTDEQTDGSIMPIADHTAVILRSAKNRTLWRCLYNEREYSV